MSLDVHEYMYFVLSSTFIYSQNQMPKIILNLYDVLTVHSIGHRH